MKKILLMLAAMLSLASNDVKAQANTKFTLVTDVFYGWPNMEKVTAPFLAARNYSDVTNIVTRGIGPTGVRNDFFIGDRWSLGIDAFYSGFKVDYTQVDSFSVGSAMVYDTNRYSDQYNRFRFQVRVMKHKEVSNPHLDIYYGFSAGTNQRFGTRYIQGVETDQELDRLTWRKNAANPMTLPFSLRACWGLRYYFTKNSGFHFEFGLGGPIFSAGVSTRFGLAKPKLPAGNEGGDKK